MSELITRAVTLDDAAALADLQNAIDVAGGFDAAYTESEVRSMLTNWVRDLERDVRVVTTPEGQIVAVGFVVPPAPGGVRANNSGGVHPEWIGRGIGRDLLAWQLDRMREKHAEGGGADWTLSSGAAANNKSAARLLRRFGYEPVRYFMVMKADLTTAPLAPVTLPDGLRMERYDARHDEAIYEAHMEAFEDHWGYERRAKEQWLSLSVRSEGFRPEHSRIVWDGDEIAAYTLGYDAAEPSEVHIGQVGTRRPWRRRGLAGMLLSDVMAAARDAGLKEASLDVDADSPTGAVGVYERVGFAVLSRFVAYERGLNQP